MVLNRWPINFDGNVSKLKVTRVKTSIFALDLT